MQISFVNDVVTISDKVRKSEHPYSNFGVGAFW